WGPRGVPAQTGRPHQGHVGYDSGPRRGAGSLRQPPVLGAGGLLLPRVRGARMNPVFQSGASPRRLVMLGSSGSSGQGSLAVVRHWPDRFRVEALAVGTKWEALLAQIREFRPDVVAVRDAEGARRLRDALARDPALAGVEVLEGEAGVRNLARLSN